MYSSKRLYRTIKEKYTSKNVEISMFGDNRKWQRTYEGQCRWRVSTITENLKVISLIGEKKKSDNSKVGYGRAKLNVISFGAMNTSSVRFSKTKCRHMSQFWTSRCRVDLFDSFNQKKRHLITRKQVNVFVILKCQLVLKLCFKTVNFKVHLKIEICFYIQ